MLCSLLAGFNKHAGYRVQEEIGRIGRSQDDIGRKLAEQDIGRIGRSQEEIGRIGRSLIEVLLLRHSGNMHRGFRS